MAATRWSHSQPTIALVGSMPHDLRSSIGAIAFFRSGDAARYAPNHPVLTNRIDPGLSDVPCAFSAASMSATVYVAEVSGSIGRFWSFRYLHTSISTPRPTKRFAHLWMLSLPSGPSLI